MLKLTKRTEYGLIALVHLVDRGGEYVSAREISEQYGMPRRLVAEVLKDLCRTDMVESCRGAAGGYALARAADEISLGQVVSALEGKPGLVGCESLGAFVDGHCDVEALCPIKSPIQRIRIGIWNLMQHTTLQALAHPERDALPTGFAGRIAGLTGSL